MSKIEERIVVMKFDNASFERGIKTTLDSLSALHKGLQMQGATKGLSDVSEAANKLNLGRIAEGVDHIASRFTALGVVAATALAKIASKVLEVGHQLVSSLTIDPISAGLKEYETNLNSIQTILSNTQWENKTLADVNDALRQLNEYSDKTIYNFGEMAKNIGTFTAAGVGMDTSVQAIKGIANLAALSGSNSQQASTAMYQLSQALATGSVKLMDWNSVVNAGMGGKVFQDNLKETARVHGVAVDSIIEEQGSFRDSLQTGWLTSEILTETLSKFTGDLTEAQLKTMGYNDEQIAGILKMGQTAQDAATKVKTFGQLVSTLQETAGSGWAKTWELIIGDFDEAKELWTNVNNVVGGFINKSAEARNKVLGDWKELGGRTVLIEGISNAFKALVSVITPIKEAFRDIFPAMTGQRLYDLTVAFRDFTEKLKIGSDTADKIGRIFKGVFAVFDIGWTIIKELAGAVVDLFKAISGGGTGGGFLELAASIGDFLVRLRDALKEGEGIKEFFDTLGKVIAIPIQAIKELAGWIKSLFDGIEGGKTGGLDRISDRFGQLAEIGGVLGKVWDKIAGFFSAAYDALSPLLNIIGEFFAQFGDKLADAFSGDNFSLALDAINTGLLAGAVLLLKKFISNGFQFDVGGGFFGAIKDSFEQLTGVFSAMQTQLKADALMKIAIAIGLLTVSVVALSLIDSDKLTKAITAMTFMFAQLLGTMAIFEKIAGSKGFLKMPIVMASLILMAIAIDLLTIAVAKLSKLDWNELTKGLLGTAILIGLLVAATKGMDTHTSGMIRAGAALILLAIAINILVTAVERISEMDWGELTQGLIGVGALLLALGLFTRFSNADKGGISSGAGLLLLAAGIYILALALEKISDMDWGEIAKGLAATAGGLIILGAALKLIPPSSILSAAAVLIVASSLGMIADAMADMGKMKWGEIGRGLTVMAGALTIIGLALSLMPATSVISAAAIFIAASALVILGQALEMLGDMDWGEIARALVALAGALGIIAVALWAMTGSVAGAAALVIVAGALAILVPILMALGNMKWSEILTGLGALAGLFLLLGIAGALLTPVIPTLIGLGIAIALIGVGLLAAGAGIALFSIGFSALVSSLDAGIETIIGAIKALLLLIPFAMEQLGLGIIAFAEVIATGAPQFQAAFVALITALLDAINELAPKIVETLVNLLSLLLTTVRNNLPKWIVAGADIIVKFLEGITKQLPRIISAATDLIVAFLNGVSQNLPKIIQAGFDLIINFINGLSNAIRSNSTKMGEAGGNLASAIIEGMVKGLAGGAGKVVEAAKNMAKNAFNAAKNFLGIGSPSKLFIELGQFTSEGMAVGIESYSDMVANSAESVGKEAILAMQKSISGLSDVLKQGDMELQPVITPVLDLSDVKKDASQIDTLLSTKPLTVSTTSDATKQVSAGYKEPATALAQLATAPGPTEVFSFVQNNTSPKALTSAEIYRQTKNQLSVAKGALNT